MFRKTYLKGRQSLIEYQLYAVTFFLLFVVFLMIPSDVVMHRSMGLTQQGRCLLDNNYAILDVPIIMPYNSTILQTSIITNPIVYQEGSHSCIDDEHISGCDALRNNTLFQLPHELFTRHFKKGDPSMTFPIDIYLLPFCVIFMVVDGLGLVHTIDQMSSNPSMASSLKVQCRVLFLSYFIQIIAIILSYYIIYSSCNPINIQLLQSCDTSMIDVDEATTFCHTLSTCGLMLAVVYTSTLSPYLNYLTMNCYAWITFTVGVFILCTGIYHLILLILYGVCCHMEERYEAQRLDILCKQGDELTLALANVPISFIDYYISDWKWLHATPQVSTTGDISAQVTYSPLTTADPESAADTDLATPPPSPPVTDIEYNASVCCICQHAMFAGDSLGSSSNTGLMCRKVVQFTM